MSRNNESVDISAILDAIKEAKSSLQDIIDDIQDSDSIEETVEISDKFLAILNTSSLS